MNPSVRQLATPENGTQPYGTPASGVNHVQPETEVHAVAVAPVHPLAQPPLHVQPVVPVQVLCDVAAAAHAPVDVHPGVPGPVAPVQVHPPTPLHDDCAVCADDASQACVDQQPGVLGPLAPFQVHPGRVPHWACVLAGQFALQPPLHWHPVTAVHVDCDDAAPLHEAADGP
jgi:hypothetical protein